MRNIVEILTWYDCRLTHNRVTDEKVPLALQLEQLAAAGPDHEIFGELPDVIW